MKRLLLTALIAFSSPALAHESSLPSCNNDYRHNCYDTKKLSNVLYMGEFKITFIMGKAQEGTAQATLISTKINSILHLY